MARIATPWFRSERNAWYVCKDGVQQLLGEHPADAPPPRKVRGRWNAPPAILQAFHALMAKPASPPKPKTAGLTVAALFDKFLDWCQKHVADRTFEDHKEHIQNFLDETPGLAGQPAAAVKPFHVQEWVDRHPTWGDSYRRRRIVSILRPYNWAAKLGYIDANPIRNVEKPAGKRREEALTPAQWQKVRDRYPDGDPFRDLLEFCWETGCRPFEARTIEPRHVFPDRLAVLFPPDEAKGKKRWRVIRMTARALAVLVRQMKDRTGGMVFLNADGNPWTAYAMNCRFCRLKKHTGFKAFAYALRHGFCERLLESGADHLTVAELLGHSNGVMVAKVYSHLNKAEDHLRKALERVNLPGDA